MSILIGLYSQRGKHGKDTLCELIGQSGFKVKRLAFGDALKKETSHAIAFDNYRASILEKYCHDQDFKDKDMRDLALYNVDDPCYRAFLRRRIGAQKDATVKWMLDQVAAPRTMRWHLQRYGNDYIREYLQDPDRWVRSVASTYRAISLVPTAYDFIVVTDMRQSNEYGWLLSCGGIPLEVRRDWFDEQVDLKEPHATDGALDDKNMAILTNTRGNTSRLLQEFVKYMLDNKGDLLTDEQRDKLRGIK